MTAEPLWRAVMQQCWLEQRDDPLPIPHPSPPIGKMAQFSLCDIKLIEVLGGCLDHSDTSHGGGVPDCGRSQ